MTIVTLTPYEIDALCNAFDAETEKILSPDDARLRNLPCLLRV